MGPLTEVLHDDTEVLVVWFEKLDADDDTLLFTHKTAEYNFPFIWMQCLLSPPPCTSGFSLLDILCRTCLLYFLNRAKATLGD